MTNWREVFSDSQKNTAVAASGSEIISSSPTEISKYGPFNYLLVQNTDTVNIEIRLDGNNIPGRVFVVPANTALELKPDDNLYFTTLRNVNLDAAVAQTANTILFRWARAERSY